MPANFQGTVVVGMSGGVDSSVAAALLQDAGYNVVGIMLRLWTDDEEHCENRCCAPEAMSLARQTAGYLNIPFYVLDARQRFRSIVVQDFLEGYAHGLTPNPCFTCNRAFRWDYLSLQADALGAEFIATGHYARLEHQEHSPVSLHKALDDDKDQSYVLSGLSQAVLRRALLPLGALTKQEVRRIAVQKGLPAASRPDSQDLCFTGGRDYREFLARLLPQTAAPGPIVDRSGAQLGEHMGLAFYTIGQRKGLHIAAPHPLYVLEKDALHNTLIVGEASELGACTLTAADINWIEGRPPPLPCQVEVKIRYKAHPARAELLSLSDGRLAVRFQLPQRDITPSQVAVFYENDRVLGSGIIQPML